MTHMGHNMAAMRAIHHRKGSMGCEGNDSRRVVVVGRPMRLTVVSSGYRHCGRSYRIGGGVAVLKPYASREPASRFWSVDADWKRVICRCRSMQSVC